MEFLQDRRIKDAYMNVTIQRMFLRGELRGDHPMQRRPDQWKKHDRDSLIVTVLRDEDIDSVKLCEQLTSKGVVLWVIDGLQRLTVLNSYRNGIFKLGRGIEFPMIFYQRVKRDRSGKALKDGHSNDVYERSEFDLRGKSYQDLPQELKERFDHYKIDVVKHLDCSDEEIGYHIRRYNRQRSLSVSQSAVTYMNNMAREVKKISQGNPFFREYDIYSEREKNNGTIEQIILESVMCMYHLEHWHKQSRRIGAYLNEFSCKEEFDRLNENLQRLGNVYRDEFQMVFTARDSFIWFTLFHRFTELPFEDNRFADFIRAFQDGLYASMAEKTRISGFDKEQTAKDKGGIVRKLSLLESMLTGYLYNKKGNRS